MKPPFTGIVVKNRNQYELGYLTEFNQIGTKITSFPGGSNLTGSGPWYLNYSKHGTCEGKRDISEIFSYLATALDLNKCLTQI